MSERKESAVPPELVRRIQKEPRARTLGVEYIELRRGYRRVALTLEPHMLNHQVSGGRL